MKYITDANMSGLAKELRAEGIDCETVHKLMVNNEDSRITIKDPTIIKFLTEQKNQITLITMDTELSEYCKTIRNSVHKNSGLSRWIHQESSYLSQQTSYGVLLKGDALGECKDVSSSTLASVQTHRMPDS